MNNRYINMLTAIGVTIILVMCLIGCGTKKDVQSGSTWEVTETTNLKGLTIAEGATIKAPDGYSLTMTIDSIQKDILPGTYQGDIVLTLSENNLIKFEDRVNYYFRQALYVDNTGVVKNKSVIAAVKGGEVTDTGAKNITITSEGENFNGIFVTDGGTYTVENAKIDFNGNGGNDFVGYGAAVMSAGDNTTFVLDNAEIKTRGVVRTAVIASGGNLIVKNSKIEAHDGVLTEEYLSNVQAPMVTGPWTLGIAGNLRATSVIGKNPHSTYINSSISSEGWGVLSTDGSSNGKLTGINSKISLTGDNGYGTYADLPTNTNSFYGCEFNVVDYGAITTGGTLNYGASTAEKVSELNASLKLGLTDNELKAIKEEQTIVNSDRFGIMFQINESAANIKDGTIFNCKKTVFLIRGSAVEINVDGSKGVQLNPGNGIITQVMDRDRVVSRKDPVTGKSVKDRYYTEPYATYSDIVKDATHDVTVADSSDIIGNYSNIELNGNFYNGITGIEGETLYPSRDLVLNFNNTKINGVISSTFAQHAKRTFGESDYRLVGEVSNTPCAAVNNGVIVSLDATSKWTITGTSYLTKLVIEDGATVTSPAGKTVTMTVNGVDTPIAAGEFIGEIVLAVN